MQRASATASLRDATTYNGSDQILVTTVGNGASTDPTEPTDVARDPWVLVRVLRLWMVSLVASGAS